QREPSCRQTNVRQERSPGCQSKCECCRVSRKGRGRQQTCFSLEFSPHDREVPAGRGRTCGRLPQSDTLTLSKNERRIDGRGGSHVLGCERTVGALRDCGRSIEELGSDGGRGVASTNLSYAGRLCGLELGNGCRVGLERAAGYGGSPEAV